jgi:hypothetical protein
MSQASAAINSARVYLNDPASISWSDAILFPPLQEAFGELILALGTNRIPVIKGIIGPILIPAGTTIFPSTPTNIMTPITMFERIPGGTNDDWEEMTQVTFLPNQDQDIELVFWNWMAQQINFIGATADREVQLYYNGYLTTPQLLTDPLGFIFAERFLGPRIASIVLSAVGQDKRALAAQRAAEANLYSVVQYNVTEDQRPRRRKKYRSAKAFGDFGGNTAPVGTIENTMPVWVAPNNAPDGVTSVFTFNSSILYMSWNGIMYFPGKGYKSVGTKQYSFIDVYGNILVPPANSIIMGQTS